MEGPRGDLGACADRAALVGRAGAARGILDDDDVELIGDGADVVEVDGHAALIDGDDGPRRRRQRLGDRVGRSRCR